MPPSKVLGNYSGHASNVTARERVLVSSHAAQVNVSAVVVSHVLVHHASVHLFSAPHTGKGITSVPTVLP